MKNIAKEKPMKDLIERQAAMLRVAKVNPVRFKSLDDFHDACVNCLKGLPSTQQWIPCSERLPTLGIRYNVTYESGEVGYADFRNKVIDINGCVRNVWDIPDYYEDDGRVVAWMPLPAPWKGV